MIPKYAYDLLVIALLLTVILLVSMKKKKELFSNSPAPALAPAVEKYPYNNKLRLVDGEYPDVENELQQKYVDYYQGDGTYKRIPLKSGTRHLLSQVDEGVLKHFRVNTYLNTDSMEINYPRMDTLLQTIVTKRIHNIDLGADIIQNGKYDYNLIHHRITLRILDLINEEFKEGKYESIYNFGDDRKYQIFKKQILSDTLVDGFTEDNRLLVLNLSFYKTDKDFHFTIQINLLYNYLQKVIIIQQIDIIGIHENEKISFDSFYPIEQKYCVLDKTEKEDKSDGKNINQIVYCHPEKLRDNDLQLSIFEDEFNKNELQDFYQAKEEEKERHLEFQKYKCFDNNGFSRSSCESYNFNTGKYGVWDKPCEKNTDCPFYKANKNYDNSRGGCIQGHCEMPVNVIRKGYRYYDTNQKPFCHGCQKEGCVAEECFTCCREQELDREKYPDLKSGDYMFLNDNRL